MKKITFIIIMGMVLSCLTSCSKAKDYAESDIIGTWTAALIESDGETYTPSEWYELHGDDINGYHIVFMESGEAYYFCEGHGETIEWELSENKIFSTYETANIKNGRIGFSYYRNTIWYQKTSDSQVIE